MRIYKFDKLKTKYHNLHSFMMEKFEKSSMPSMSTINNFFILMDKEPSIPFEESIEQKHCKLQTSILIESHIAFDNRHKKNTHEPRGKPKLLYHNEALDKFCHHTGLEKTNSSFCEFTGQNFFIKNQFNIHNTFKIYGLFQVKNIDQFNNALFHGVGSRKSYGFGLILWKEEERQ
jgi:hypothetical protein